MKKKNINIFLLSVILLMIVGIVVTYYHLKIKETSTVSTKTDQSSTVPNPQNNTRTSQIIDNVIDYSAGELPGSPTGNQVFYNDSGFEPAVLTVKRGTIVTFFNMNKSQKLLVNGVTGDNIPTLGYKQYIGLSFNEAGTILIKNSESPNYSMTVKVD